MSAARVASENPSKAITPWWWSPSYQMHLVKRVAQLHWVLVEDASSRHVAVRRVAAHLALHGTRPTTRAAKGARTERRRFSAGTILASAQTHAMGTSVHTRGGTRTRRQQTRALANELKWKVHQHRPTRRPPSARLPVTTPHAVPANTTAAASQTKRTDLANVARHQARSTRECPFQHLTNIGSIAQWLQCSS